MPADPIKSTFQKLCDVSQRLKRVSMAHRTRPCVDKVVPRSTLSTPLSGAEAVLYTEFTLHSTAVVDWIVEIECEPQWNILAGIRIYRTSYEESLGDLGEWTTSDSNEVNALLENAIGAVEESIRTFDFCQY